MKSIITVGETMAVLIAEETGRLADCNLFSKGVAGAEMNVAIGVTRLGLACTYITKLGQDPFGEYITDFLKENNLYTPSIIEDNVYSTGMYMKSKVLEGDPSVYYYRKNSAASHLEPQDLDAIDFSQHDLLHITGITPALSQSCLDTCQAAIDKAKQANIPISFDPNIRPSLWPSTETMVEVLNSFAQQVDIVLPGIAEGKLLTGKETPQEIANFYLDLGAQIVVMKLGETGSAYFTKDQTETVAGYNVTNVVDTVGAGDAFASGFLSGYLRGDSLAQALQRGNAMGAIIITSKEDNAALPTEEALQTYMAQNSNTVSA